MEVRRSPHKGDHLVGVIEEVAAEVRADETIGAGDEYPLRRSRDVPPCARVALNRDALAGCSPPSISKYTRAVKGYPYSCAAAATFGLESLVRDEIEQLGIHGTRVEDRRVHFSATAREIARCNLWLRAADRVLVTLGQFAA